MTELKLCQLIKGDWKQDEVQSYALKSSSLKSQDLYAAVIGSQTEITLFKLTRLFGPECPFPFEISTIAVPQDRPCLKLVEGIDLPKIYSKCSVLESQELAIEPMYVAPHGTDLLKASIIHVEFVPRSEDKRMMLTLLTSYGACQLWDKDDWNRCWTKKLNNFDKFFMNSFSVEASHTTNITTLKQLQNYVDLHWITAFAWSESNEPTIFLASAAGYIVALSFKSMNIENEALECGKQLTKLGRITFLKSFDKFLLVGNLLGAFYLFTVQKSNGIFTFTETECLWSKADRMTIQKTLVRFVENLNSYYVVTSKAAHVLAYCLTKSGSISASSTLYIGGARITDFEMFSDDEFFVTTITGIVHNVRLSKIEENELKIEDQVIPTDVDTTNMQILGICSTPKRSMWQLLLYRYKEYVRTSDFTNQSVFLSVSKLNNFDLLEPLHNSDLTTFDSYIDHFVAMRIEIFTGQNVEYYNELCDLENLILPAKFSNKFLQKLQIQYQIVQNTSTYEISKFGNKKEETACKLDFLQHAIQIVHFISRLARIQETLFEGSGHQKPTTSQKLSIKCMQITCRKSLEVMSSMNTVNSDFLHNSTQRFIKVAETQLKLQTAKIPTYIECIEKCLYCDQQVNPTTLQCSDEHVWPRCCITCLQVPLCSKNYCKSCNSYALDDDALLKEFIAPGECVKCSYCRFSFEK